MWRTISLLSILFSTSLIAADTPTCNNGFTLISGKCLKLVTDPALHMSAEATCAKYDATLVTVKSKADNDAIAQIASVLSSSVWIGLFCFDSDPSKCFWDDGSGVVTNFNGFSTGFPLTEIGQCVYYANDGSLKGKWLNGRCDSEYRSFVCEQPPTYSQGCQYNYAGHCYYFMQDYPYPYDNAEAYCVNKGGHLASIHSINENVFLRRVLLSTDQQDYLIGTRFSYPDTFTWADGSAFDYNNLEPSMPYTSTCFAMSGGTNTLAGFWFSVDCNSLHNYICKVPIGDADGTLPPVTVTPLPWVRDQCNGTLLMAPGMLTSSFFPNPYNTYKYCVYHISTLGSYNIQLHFLSFSTNYYDYVNVYDGDSTHNALLGSYSGTKAPFSVISSGNSLTVTLETGNTPRQGFQARFTPYARGNS